MNGVTAGTVGVLPWDTTTFSHTSTTVRRRSAGSSASSWFSRALVAESLDEVKGSANSSAEFTCGVTDEDSMVAQAEKTVSLVLGIEQEIWLVEDLLFVLCTFEDEALRATADKVDEFEVQSELVDEDLTWLFRERGVGILDVFRVDAGLDPELTSNERELVGTVVALTAENDNWWVSAVGMFEDGGNDKLEGCSLDRFSRFAWLNLGLACSMESFRLADTIDSLALGSESVLSSIMFLPNIRAFERLSGVTSRGDTLELGWIIARGTEICDRSVLELIVVSTCACGCDLLVDSSPGVSAVSYRIREL